MWNSQFILLLRYIIITKILVFKTIYELLNLRIIQKNIAIFLHQKNTYLHLATVILLILYALSVSSSSFTFHIHVFTFKITSLYGTIQCSIMISSFIVEPRRIPGPSELFS